jgi:DNA-binding NarL/FixJ family response regulator
MSTGLRLAVIDSDDMVREGRLLLLQSQLDLQVVFETSDPRGALELLGDYLIDVILVESRIPGLTMEKYLGQLSQVLDDSGSAAQVIAMANFVSMAEELAWLKAGAAGVVSHELGASALLRRTRVLGAGDLAIERERIDMLLADVDDVPELHGALAISLKQSDPSQTAVLKALLNGSSDAQIAKDLGLTKYRVGKFLESIKLANGFRTRTQLAIELLGFGAF